MQIDKEFLRDYFKLILAVALLSYFYFYGGTKFNLIDLSAVSKTGILLAGIWLALLLVGKTRQTPVDAPIVGVILVMLLTSFTGILPRQALVEVGYILIAVMLFYFVAGVMQRSWNPRIISKAILIVGGVFMILSWMEFFRWLLAWWQLGTGAFQPPFDYRLPAPNFICVIMNIWFLFTLAHFLHVKEKLARFLLGAYLLSALGIIYLTSSRGGWLGLAGGLAVFFIIYVLKQQSVWLKDTWKKIRQPKYLIPLILLGMLVLLAIGYLFLQQNSQPTHGPILQSRDLLWKPAFKAVADSPWIGHGPYAYIFYFLRVNSVPPTLLYDYAHNIYLDILISSGVLGLIAFAILLFVLLKTLIKVLNQPDPYLFTLTLGVIGGLAAFLFHGLFDSVHHTVPVSLWNLCVLLGIPVGMGSRTAVKKSYLPLILGILLLPSIGWFIYSGTVFEKGLTYAQEGNLPLAISQIEKAKKIDSTLPLLSQQKGILYAQLADQNGNLEDLKLARQAFEDSVVMEDSWAASDLNLGVVSAELGENDAAETYLLRAVELAPRSELNFWNLGVFYESMGQQEKAAQAFEQVLTLDSRLIFSNVWQQNPFRESFSMEWKAKNQQLVAQYEQTLSSTTGGFMGIRYPSHVKKPAYTLHHIEQAAIAIRENRLQDAQHLLDEGQLAYTNFPESNLQTMWLEGEIYAARQDWEQAAIWGDMALQAVMSPGLYGVGSYGQPTFGPVVYRRHELPDYFVPQVHSLPINMEWSQRMDRLIQWYEQSGNEEKTSYWKTQRSKLDAMGS